MAAGAEARSGAMRNSNLAADCCAPKGGIVFTRLLASEFSWKLPATKAPLSFIQWTANDASAALTPVVVVVVVVVIVVVI